MEIKSFDKTKIFYIKHKPKKKKPWLVFIHGWLANYTFWEKEILYFKKKGYGIIALDLRGFGYSWKYDKSLRIEDMAKDVDAVLKKEKIIGQKKKMKSVNNFIIRGKRKISYLINKIPQLFMINLINIIKLIKT